MKLALHSTKKLSTFLLGLILALGLPRAGSAQQTADKIIAVVGKGSIILQSELMAEIQNFRQQDGGPENIDSLSCLILDQMVLRKVMVEQAERDSIIVSPEEVEATLENRVRYFTSLYGSKERLEEISGKTIYQLKEENRELIKEGLITERMQQEILSNVHITPAEVHQFFRNIPADSLPFFPATVEVGQIVIDPPINPEIEAYSREKLENIRKEILEEGKDFEIMAGLYSEDPGSRDQGGDLGTVGRMDVVPEFAAAAFKLQNGEISPVVETKFGFHIIQMVRRQGEMAHLRHILIRPNRTSADFRQSMDKLDSVRAELISGKISFGAAVAKYATDDLSARTGGMILDPQTGSSELTIDQLDPSLALMIDSLKVGSYSPPHPFVQENGERSTRIVFLKSRTDPHQANLQDDYSRIQQAALQQKRGWAMEDWVRKKASSYYIRIDPDYADCPSLQVWTQKE